MYRLDWVEQIKLGTATVPAPRQVAKVGPVVWKLGVTSLLTDVSAEMVNSVLPAYLVLHLRMSPLEYGAIDGVYNGIAVALLALAGGVIADRTRRHKEVAAFGYGVSAISKLLLLAAGAAWGWITAVVAIDRTGKGSRTAPRDALISMSCAPDSLATGFALHRTLDAAGSLLGPIVAFALLARLPGAFDAVWMTSFVFAVVGLAVLWLFVDNPPAPTLPACSSVDGASRAAPLPRARFGALVLAGVVLSVATMSDGFVYLLLQQRSGVAAGFFPLFYVVTACWYMLLSIPVGRVADRWGRRTVLLAGYVVLAIVYAVLFSSASLAFAGSLLCLFLFGLYYAATEGVLAAIASAIIPVESRTSGLAVLATSVSFAKMGSSLLFGLLWQAWGTGAALAVFAAGLVVALPIAARCLKEPRHEAAA